MKSHLLGKLNRIDMYVQSKDVKLTDSTRLNDQISEIITRMSSLSSARDAAINSSRAIVRSSANAIRALHRGDNADELLTEARTLLDQVVTDATPYPSVYWAGFTQDAMKEYAEAVITKALLTGSEIPSPNHVGVEDTAWLNGLAEAASELRRDTLDALRRDDTDRAEELLSVMDMIYGQLVTIDFPDSITSGLRRTTDQFRGVLERTRGDVTMSVRQTRLERALRDAEKSV